MTLFKLGIFIFLKSSLQTHPLWATLYLLPVQSVILCTGSRWRDVVEFILHSSATSSDWSFDLAYSVCTEWTWCARVDPSIPGRRVCRELTAPGGDKTSIQELTKFDMNSLGHFVYRFRVSHDTNHVSC